MIFYPRGFETGLKFRMVNKGLPRLEERKWRQLEDLQGEEVGIISSDELKVKTGSRK